MALELTILMPCLNEERSIAFSIGAAKRFIEENGISAGILIADNGSEDSSRAVPSREIRMRGESGGLPLRSARI